MFIKPHNHNPGKQIKEVEKVNDQVDIIQSLVPPALVALIVFLQMVERGNKTDIDTAYKHKKKSKFLI